MPIYEFHCGACKKASEILVRSSDWKGAKCPHCASTKLDKKFSVFASSGTGNDAESSGGSGGGGCCGGGPHHH